MVPATETVEVVVVGGGFAGLRAASAAARRGARVLVLERKHPLGEPVRTSGASWIAAMERLRIPPRLYHPVRVAHLHAATREATLDYPEPVGCILDVAGVVRHLAAEARAAGAEVRAGVEVRGLLEEGGRAAGVRTATGEVRAAWVVDASGISCLLGRELSRRPYRRYGLGHEVRLRAPSWDPEEIRFWVGPPAAPSGYAWAFPEGDGTVRVGMGLLRPDHPGSPRAALEALLGSSRPELTPLAGAPVLEVRTGAIPSEPPPLSRPYGPGWIQVGDAAGHVSPLLGEGIRFCLEAGERAGDAVARALHAPTRERREHALRGYAAALDARWGRKLRLEHRLNRRLSRLDAAGWDRAVELVARLPGELPLALLEGRFDLRLLLGLGRIRPGLAWELARGLLRAS